ncbi:hypothetical protein [Paenarthrobacter nitroguajacolicus]|uniref:hypothetical protein n=1 Tax=Paenarthrobacter nitroguajacolicus TaxID=211146 RepID=UPI0028553335|nr:hypothetical protein [Paenarthrobacter nitroguajacolicus]MDR6639573.1 putative integral membrane protein [Paenarthrobacter nitroguajacolicus]
MAAQTGVTMNTQTPPGVTLAEIFPGLLPVLDHVMMGALIFMVISMIYLAIEWGIAHSRMEDIDPDTLPFDLGFITAISLPLILLNSTRSITGLILGAAIGAILALGTYLLLRRHRATHPRTTP